MKDETQNDTRKVLVGGMVDPAIRRTIETLANKHDRSLSYIAGKVMELDPDTLKEYRQTLQQVRAAA